MKFITEYLLSKNKTKIKRSFDNVKNEKNLEFLNLFSDDIIEKFYSIKEQTRRVTYLVMKYHVDDNNPRYDSCEFIVTIDGFTKPMVEEYYILKTSISPMHNGIIFKTVEEAAEYIINKIKQSNVV